MAVAPQRGPKRGRRSRRPAVEQPGQVLRLLPGRRHRDHPGGYLTDPSQLPQRPCPRPGRQLARAQAGNNLRRRPPERPDPIRRGAGSRRLERDLPQRPHRIHACQLTNQRRSPGTDDRDRPGFRIAQPLYGRPRRGQEHRVIRRGIRHRAGGEWVTPRRMTTVSELAGQLAGRVRNLARTACYPQQLEPLACAVTRRSSLPSWSSRRSIDSVTSEFTRRTRRTGRRRPAGGRLAVRVVRWSARLRPRAVLLDAGNPLGAGDRRHSAGKQHRPGRTLSRPTVAHLRSPCVVGMRTASSAIPSPARRESAHGRPASTEARSAALPLTHRRAVG
jgi:hypothetical protein